MVLPALAATLLLAVPAAAEPIVTAHRGGPYVNSAAVFPENTLPGFAQAANQGDVLEFDIKLSKDGVPVVIHDPTLDRTTTCTGRVVDKTAKQLSKCYAKVLGVPENGVLSVRKVADPSVPVPTLKQVLDLAARTGATISPEIKNYPTDSDYDGSGGFARAASNALAAGPVPQEKMILQSFTTENLDVARAALPRAQMSLLALTSGNENAIPTAVANGYEWVSPQYPIDSVYVTAAHAAGRRVTPYTLDTADQIASASASGVDALITNDPTLARKILRQPDPAAKALKASLGSTKVKISSGGTASVKVSCKGSKAKSCVGGLVVGGKGLRGSAQFAVAGGSSQTVKVTLEGGKADSGTVALTAAPPAGRSAKKTKVTFTG